MFGYSVVILVLFLIITIIFIAYLVCSRSVVSPPRRHHQLEHVRNVETGLDDATLKTWPKLSYAEAKRRDARAAAGDCCSICLVHYEENGGKVLRLLPACGHLFHVKCLDPWLRLRPICPMCRSSVVDGAVPTTLPESALAEVIPLEIGQT